MLVHLEKQKTPRQPLQLVLHSSFFKEFYPFLWYPFLPFFLFPFFFTSFCSLSFTYSVSFIPHNKSNSCPDRQIVLQWALVYFYPLGIFKNDKFYCSFGSQFVYIVEGNLRKWRPEGWWNTRHATPQSCFHKMVFCLENLRFTLFEFWLVFLE